MKVTATAVYSGPSAYALCPVIRHTVDLGSLEDWPAGRLGAAFIDGLLAAGVAAESITEVPEEEKAVVAALDMAGAGDLVVIFASNTTRSWKQITGFGGGADRAGTP